MLCDARGPVNTNCILCDARGPVNTNCMLCDARGPINTNCILCDARGAVNTNCMLCDARGAVNKNCMLCDARGTVYTNCMLCDIRGTFYTNWPRWRLLLTPKHAAQNNFVMLIRMESDHHFTVLVHTLRLGTFCQFVSVREDVSRARQLFCAPNSVTKLSAIPC